MSSKNTVIIERLESSNEGTFGLLMVDSLTLFTGELPWRNNESDISCIPIGTYKGLWTYSNRFKREMYLIGPVDGRAGIRIHSANFMGDTAYGFKRQLNGCIALGEKIGLINGQKGLLLSRPAIRRFESYMNKEPFILEIS